MDEDEYESLPPNASSTDHMVAGAAAGIMEHCIIYPVDVVKVCYLCVQFYLFFILFYITFFYRLV